MTGATFVLICAGDTVWSESASSSFALILHLYYVAIENNQIGRYRIIHLNAAVNIKAPLRCQFHEQ